MVKIEVLNNGVLFVHTNNGDRYEMSIDALSAEIREKLAILQATDPGVRIPAVGIRTIPPNNFWIMEDGDLDDPQGANMMKNQADLSHKIWLKQYVKGQMKWDPNDVAKQGLIWNDTGKQKK